MFTAVFRLVPSLAPWLEVLDPTTGIFVMGGLHNTLRRLVTGGVPVATGLHAIGDTVCTTNPTLARGLALAMTGAADLAECSASTAAAPWRRRWRLTPAGACPGAGADRIGYHQVRAAAAFDPVVFRAFWRVQGMIATPGEVYTDPEVIARTREVLRTRGAGGPADQPSREQLSAALTT